MKKLLLFVAAILASVNLANGQARTIAGPLRPSATVPYTYAVNISAINGYTDAGNFTWYVTTNPDIISGSEVPSAGSVITVGTGLTYGKANVAAGQKTINLIWSADAVALAVTNPYYLIVKYGQNSGTCSASNMKVWKISPVNNFLLAIEAVDNAGLSTTGIYCAADITNAVISDDHVAYAYGRNTFYSKVTASNITGEWTPSVKISTLNIGQTINELGWSATVSGTYTAFTGAANSTGGEFTSPVKAIAASDGSLLIFIKLVISNGTWEGLTDQNIAIGIDGAYSAASLKDVISNTDCTEEVNFGKTVTQTIKARPTIISNTPSGDPLAVPIPPVTNFLIP
ncbi:MAG: hypothetical protein NTY07_04915 [Bacteroidia bacterium]|nr:hypothetical protein [Bacteroidia bacterium]